jgi:hypothetical protein
MNRNMQDPWESICSINFRCIMLALRDILQSSKENDNQVAR